MRSRTAPRTTTGSDMLTTGQASRRLGVSINTIKSWVQSGRLNAQRSPVARGHLRIPREEVERLATIRTPRHAQGRSAILRLDATSHSGESHGMSDLSTPTAEAIGRTDAKVRRIQAARPLTQTQLQSLHDDFVVRYAHATTAIEGNTLTLRETQVVIENGITVKGKTLIEHLEVNNIPGALKRVTQLVSDGAAITEDVVQDLHALIGHGVVANPGLYRRVLVFITGARHVPPNWVKVTQLMGQWAAETSQELKSLHPLVAAGRLHGKFVTIHPFENGNGRTVRLLTSLAVMQHGYPPALYTVQDRVEYLSATEQANFGQYDALVAITARAVEDMADRYLLLLEA